MFKKRWLITSIISAALLSMAAFASPIDTSHFNVTVPVTITEMSEDSTTVTQADFVVVMPYVVDLAVATPVPIDLIDVLVAEAVLAADRHFENLAVMQNLNFERQQ